MTLKISSVILLVTVNSVIAVPGYSQTARLSLDIQNKSLEYVMDDIERQSEFYFVFNQKQIDVDREVNIQVDEGLINEVLSQLFDGTNINYAFIDRKILLTTESLSDKLINRTPDSKQQQYTVTGLVTDAKTNEPLPGVTIQVKGTTTGTITKPDGTYSIAMPSSSGTLIYSFIGYTTQEVQVEGQSVLDMVMSEAITALDEVIVTGYSTEKKRDIIGSVAIVNTDEMLQTNSVNVSGQLQGRVSGVFVTSTGNPGDDSKVRVRGFNSFGESEPLYIIDGTPANSTAFNNLNPNDVESIQVLKDAAAASVYGARAASGVLIITTKRGQVGKAKITVDMYTGVNYVSANDFPEMLNAQEYGEYWWKSYENPGLTPTHAAFGSGAEPVIPEYLKAGTYSGSALEALKTSDPTLFSELVDPANYDFINHQIVKSADTDWFDEIFNSAAITNIQIGATGGSESGTYALSLSYYTQDNTSNQWSKYNRYTIRANSLFNITQNIRLGENLQVAFTNSEGSGSGSSGCFMNPVMPVWDIMGNPASGAVAGMGNVQNPISSRWRNRFDKSNAFNVFGNVFAELTLLKDLVLRSSFGVNYNSTNVWNITQQTYEHAENTSISSLSRSFTYANSWTWTNTATYSKTLGSHVFKLLLGSEAIRDYSDNITAYREEYEVNDDPNFVTLDTGTGTQGNSGDFSRTSLSSLFGRLDYSYADKYLINATIRRDGSSKFGKNNRYGVFPAIGIGWRISQEQFMSDLIWLTDLKIRASYGVIGNQTGLPAQNQYTIYTQTIDNGYDISGGDVLIAGFGTESIGNPDAKWERSITTNIGFDATFLSGKYNASFEYYIKQTKDLLVQNQPPHTGSWATQPYVNIGDMTNRGVDLNISTKGSVLGNLSYDIGVNFSLYRNTVDKVLDSDDSYLPGASDADHGVITRSEKGHPISYIWGWELDGFFETQDEADDYAAEYTSPIPAELGRWRLKDTNGDKSVTDEDKIELGSPHPNYQVGLNISLAYKGFDFSTFVFWSQGGKIYNMFRREVDMNRWQYNRSKRMLYQSWDPEPGANNSDAILPILDINDTQTKMVAADYYVEDATYIRMKTLQFGYTLPQNIIRTIKLEKLRIYVQAQNLFTVLGGDKPFTGLDPDASLQGNDVSMGVVNTQNPTPKQFVVGLNLNF